MAFVLTDFQHIESLLPSASRRSQVSARDLLEALPGQHGRYCSACVLPGSIVKQLCSDLNPVVLTDFCPY